MTLPQLSPLGEAAVAYAKRRWYVFPLRPGSKGSHYLDNGHKGASNDPEQVRRWWVQWPDANIGLSLAASGLMAIDIDLYKAECDWESAVEGKELPNTLAQSTPSGGLHFILRCTEGASYPGKLCRGVDLKHKGYVLLEPSTIEGKPYRFSNDLEPAPAPDWLLRKPLSEPQGTNPTSVSLHDLERVRALLESRSNRLERDEWVRLALALKSTGGDSLREAFLTFSYRWPDTEEDDPERVWDTAKPNGQLGLSTVYFILKGGHADEGELSEHGVAATFAARFQGQVRFDHDQSAWMFWHRDHWHKDETERAYSHCRDIARELSEPEQANKRFSARKASFATGALKLATSDQSLAATSKAWDKEPFMIGCPDGMIDLKSGQLLGPDPMQGISKRLSIAPADGDCPKWLGFLKDATGNDEALVSFLQRWCGYCLTGDTSEQQLLFIYGPGGNGKSVFLDTAMYVLGEYAVTAPMDTFAASKFDRHTTELAMLQGARMVAASETEEGRAWAETRIKQLTGGDRISARFMRRDFFTFKPQFKLTLVGNHKPSLSNVDEAMRRRVNIVPFMLKPSKPDPRLTEKLKAEAPQILRWMVEGCLAWQRDGLNHPDAVRRATQEYFEDQDLIGQFLEERCLVDLKDSAVFETSASLFSAWCLYCRGAGQPAGTQKAFGEALKKRGFVSIKKRIGRGWQGIKLTQSLPIAGLPGIPA